MVNALVLLVVCGYLAYAGISRLADPTSVDAGPMIAFAAVGLLANAVSLADPQPLRHRLAQPARRGQRGVRRPDRVDPRRDRAAS